MMLSDSPGEQELGFLRKHNSIVPFLLERRFDESFWRYRLFGLKLLTILHSPLRKKLKSLCQGFWVRRGFLLAFDGLYLLIWIKSVVFGKSRDLRLVLGLHLLALRRID